MALRLFISNFSIVTLIATTAHAGWFSYDNYDNCMLGKMKGQNISMSASADKECKRQFKVEFPISSNGLKWSFDHARGETIITLEKDPDFIYTEGTFTFSEQPCAIAKASDFLTPATIRLDSSGSGKYTYSIREMLCGKVSDLKARFC